MSLLIFNLILVLLLIVLFIILSWVWPPDSPWSPWWKTDRKTARAICDLVKIQPGDTVYELGSGDGEFLLEAAKTAEGKFVGVEIDPLRYWISRLRVKLAGLDERIKIIKNNFFKVDLSDASIVYVYLVPKALARLLPKLKKDLKTGTKLVSFVYEINLPLLKKDEAHKLFLYKLK